VRVLGAGLVTVVMPQLVWAQTGSNPWTHAATQMMEAFQGPISRALSIVAVIVGGLLFMFNEGGSKRMLAGIVFGGGMALGAANLLAWLFGI